MCVSLTLDEVPTVPNDAHCYERDGHRFCVSGDFVWRFDGAGLLLLFVQKLAGMRKFPMWGPWAKCYRNEEVSP